ncbi:hypothetical protein [Oceanithermus profundus]
MGLNRFLETYGSTKTAADAGNLAGGDNTGDLGVRGRLGFAWPQAEDAVGAGLLPALELAGYGP